MAESEVGKPTIPTTPGTPGTPGGSLFTALQVDSLRYEHSDRKTVPPCMCFPIKAPSLSAPQTCFTGVSIPNVSLTRKLGAEFIGTFILIFIATAGPIVNQKYNGTETLIGNAACAGLAVMVVILSTGHISGAHLNPSLTIAFATLRHFPWVHVPAYIAAQVSASIFASFVLKGVFHPFMSGGVTVPSIDNAQAFTLEFVITFNLLFVVTAVATDTRAVGELAGIAVGAVVMVNILIAGPSTGGSMNPVRTLGPAIAAGNYDGIWIYMMAPTLGALTGAGIYTLVKLRDDEVPLGSVRSFRR
ncbi:Aquaporin (Major intrinsic protein family) [Heracleum sosnowskyi]|uniref:Aquaporin (Major intrinsic protein family) n=1 Tax=Heracleum sosnowskyi TaxID=360622 RepID=A0AAD8HSW6_9APIA|nr:Aquaporin (Major intrinsic protein family) [Heracleum sosnowskyi]